MKIIGFFIQYVRQIKSIAMPKHNYLSYFVFFNPIFADYLTQNEESRIS